jgi:hypothetical protein
MACGQAVEPSATPSTPNTGQMPAAPSNNLACPSCGQTDQVQKVSAVYEGGITRGQYSGPTGGAAYTFGRGGGWTVGGAQTTLRGTTQTSLSQLLAPPARPAGLFWQVWGPRLVPTVPVLLAWAMLDGVMNVFRVNWGSNITNPCIENGVSCDPKLYVGFVVFSILAVGLIILAVWLWVRAFTINTHDLHQRYTQTLASWEVAMRRWHSAYYCHRCDSVFIAGSANRVPPAQARASLWSYS